jgi:hypothetical protein
MLDGKKVRFLKKNVMVRIEIQLENLHGPNTQVGPTVIGRKQINKQI